MGNEQEGSVEEEYDDDEDHEEDDEGEAAADDDTAGPPRPQTAGLVELKKAKGTPWECTKCQRWMSAKCFRTGQLTHNSTNTRVCTNCIERRKCVKCENELEEKDIAPGE